MSSSDSMKVPRARHWRKGVAPQWNGKEVKDVCNGSIRFPALFQGGEGIAFLGGIQDAVVNMEIVLHSELIAQWLNNCLQNEQ
eukprot:1140995-Pelagomonas_calceolata.AAC.1